ncbi:MAG: serpin family protein [Agathobacter sp.]|nr:serpin family protein [Agathobacter sp.]
MKWRRNKIVSIALIFVMCLSLTACSGGSVGKDLPLEGATDLTANRNKDTIYCFADTVITDKDYDEATVNVALTDFAVRLFQKNLAMEAVGGGSSKNILISPTSIISALGMTTFGAKGDTLTQMENVFGLSRGHLNYYNSQYLMNLSNELKLANSIWMIDDDRLTVKDEFLQFNEEFYGADIYKTPFDDKALENINKWVELNTDGMIKDILDEIPKDAVMYLINALVFEAEWEEKYDSTQIAKGQIFTASNGAEQKVDMMCSNERLYLEDENAKGFVKYYKDRNYAFVALLPNEDTDVYNYVKNLCGEHLQNLLANPVETNVDVRIPQFSYEYDIEMSELLEEMGMTDAFEGSKADFTDMATSTNGNIWMNRVLHKTFIEVSPVGTKAGAATVVECMDECATIYEDQKEVHLNRPFIYMIIDCESNQPVFIGTVSMI